MPASTKTTSLTKVVETLYAAGWEFSSESTDVPVKDYDSKDVVHSYGGRARWVPTKMVPGVKVSAFNKDNAESKSFTAFFTENGAYLADKTSGTYPFWKGTTLTGVLKKVEEYAPTVLADRRAKRAAEEQASERAEEAAVREAFEVAKAAEEQAKAALVENLLATGMTQEQADFVVNMVTTPETAMQDYVGAVYNRERIGKGFLPGRSYVSGTYVDGQRAS